MVVGFATRGDLDRSLRGLSATVVRSLPALRTAELRTTGSALELAARLVRRPGIEYAQPAVTRRRQAEPARFASARSSYEWEWAAAREDAVPDSVLRLASSITIAVVDTGADLTAPDLAAKAPTAYDVFSHTTDVRDLNGHGTFVASLAAGSVSNDDGMAGFGGDARLLIIRAGGPDGSFTDVDEAAGIVYAVEHGARIVNLSLGGPTTSQTELRAVAYAASRGVLLIAAAGNERHVGNPIEYPAALLQPVGSNGVGGTGLSVAASAPDGGHAPFSNTGSYISLAAPGVNVLGAVASTSPATLFPRSPLASAGGGLYGYASGTSFAAPEVAGAAALVWAANPSLAAGDVAQILKDTASGLGSWSPELGYGIIDVSAAVAKATGSATVLVSQLRVRDRAHLMWSGSDAASYRVSAAEDAAPERVLLPSTTLTDAWFPVEPGHTYTFTVAALDETGAELALSAPVRIRIDQAAASLSLAAKPLSAERMGKVSFRAVLRSTETDVQTGSRAVALEVLAHGRWKRSGTVATTDALGRATWSLTLPRGSYSLRASFSGGVGLASALSRELRVVVP